jgi:hypothetical protein
MKKSLVLLFLAVIFVGSGSAQQSKVKKDTGIVGIWTEKVMNRTWTFRKDGSLEIGGKPNNLTGEYVVQETFKGTKLTIVVNNGREIDDAEFIIDFSTDGEPTLILRCIKGFPVLDETSRREVYFLRDRKPIPDK